MNLENIMVSETSQSQKIHTTWDSILYEVQIANYTEKKVKWWLPGVGRGKWELLFNGLQSSARWKNFGD